MGTEYIAVAFTILFTIATSAFVGGYMYRVFTGKRTWLDPVFLPIERLVLRVIGTDPSEQALPRAGTRFASGADGTREPC